MPVPALLRSVLVASATAELGSSLPEPGCSLRRAHARKGISHRGAPLKVTQKSLRESRKRCLYQEAPRVSRRISSSWLPPSSDLPLSLCHNLQGGDSQEGRTKQPPPPRAPNSSFCYRLIGNLSFKKEERIGRQPSGQQAGGLHGSHILGGGVNNKKINKGRKRHVLGSGSIQHFYPSQC